MDTLTRLLLGLYSSTFRRRYGADALLVLRRDLTEAGPVAGVGILLAFAAHGILDRLQRMGTEVDGWGRHVLQADFWMGWGQDLRHAARSVRRRLGFTAVAVLSLAVGVGANGVVFAVVDTLAFRDIPGVPEPDRVLELSPTYADGGTTSWDYPDIQDVATEVEGIDAVALFDRGTVGLAGDGGGERLLAQYVSSRYFDVFGLDLARGGGFPSSIDTDRGDHPLVVLSHALWQGRFEGDPGIVGGTVRVNREPHTVVGVAPATFHGHEFGIRPDVYLPLTQYPSARRDPDRFWGSRGTLWVGAVARMAPGATVEGVNASLRTVMRRLEEAHPDSNEGRSARAAQAGLIPMEGRAMASAVLGLLGGLMLLVLCATAANVGGMLLARATSRRREMAVRMALGSGRARLVRHLLTEALLIFLLGGAAGLLVARSGMRWFADLSSLPTFLPVSVDFVVDWRMAVFALALTAGVGLVFGLLPALQATRESLSEGMREGGGGGRRTTRVRSAFVAGQVTVSILLLSAASVFTRSLGATEELDVGFEPAGVYLTDLDLALEGREDPERAIVFLDQALERLEALPEVVSAMVATDLPLDGRSSSTPVWPDGRAGRDEGSIRSDYASVTEGFFETLGIGVVSGRVFSAQDGRASAPVVVIDRLLAASAWPGENPLGRTLEFGLEPRSYEVIGVVETTQTDMIMDRPAPQVFTLLDQEFRSDVFVAVRGRGDGTAAIAAARRELLRLDPGLALARTQALSDFVDLGKLPQRIIASVAGVLGSLALLLSAMGVYGVIAHTVERRTREIGVRMALGSSRSRVRGRVLVDGVRLALPGFLVGVPLAFILTSLMRGLLVGVSPVDPTAFAAVATLFLMVVAIASFLPARRASGVQPVEALRSE